MITNRDTLYKAAMGKQVKSEPAPPATPTAESSRYPTAPGYQYNPNQAESANVLANLLASGSTGAGRSTQGKYSGFYSAGDLESAIKGSAIGLRENVPAQLESKASARYQAMDKLYRQALGSVVPFTTEYDPRRSSAGNFRIAETLASTPSLKQARRDVSEYMIPLGSWYQEQAEPAEQYVEAAQQLRETPLSELATSIATRQYGMNPNLAIGKFAGLDAEYFPTLRNKEYMDKYGMSYDEYKFEEEKKATAEKDYQTKLDASIKGSVESSTGIALDKLKTASGKTAQQMADAFSKQFDIDGETYNGTGAALEVRDRINSGDVNGAIDFVRAVQSTVGGQDLALILNAMLKYYVVSPYQTQLDLEEAGYR